MHEWANVRSNFGCYPTDFNVFCFDYVIDYILYSVALLVEALPALQTPRSRARFPMVSLEFFIDIILPAALWPWSRLSL
jgi:hypothetical protein